MFAFALTLLVVSLEVPQNVGALREVLNGFPAFAATFAIICWIWYQHVTFLRRFGFDDVPTVMLNCVLLFLVLFFVYPLKFTFSGMLGPAVMALTIADTRWLLLVYSAGFIAVFVVFVVLHANAYRQRARLGFDTLESHDAHAGICTHLLSVGVGVLPWCWPPSFPPAGSGSRG